MPRISLTFPLLIVSVVVLCLGCGGEAARYVKSKSHDSTISMPHKSDSNSELGFDESYASDRDRESEDAIGITLPADRKIIYTASMEIVVEQFDGIQAKITTLVGEHGGFVSAANLGRMTGERRSGRWTVRVPVENYHDFLDSVGDIGIPASRNENASDVTEEFVDITARIANKKKLEARIVELLERPDDKIQHVIEVERELARVREAIERMEGRMRYLADATSFTTVTIQIREERDYVPPQAATLTTRIKNAWEASLANGKRVFENAVVFVVANAIGFGIFLLVCLIAIPILRMVWRRLARLNSRTAETSTSSSGTA